MSCTMPQQIQELEDELSALQQQCESQAQQLEHKDAEVSALKTQLSIWRSVKDAEAASLVASNKQLTQQLSQEIARCKTAEGHTTCLQAQLVSAPEQLASAVQQAQWTHSRVEERNIHPTQSLTARFHCC
jgi:chromosome segregation ATPase